MRICDASHINPQQAGIPQIPAAKISIVIPCLNEARSIGFCVDKAFAALRSENVSGEVVVADNGSTDGSEIVARQHGARVVHVSKRGYGNAVRTGMQSAEGDFVIIGDADDTYDFFEISKFVEKWREGYDFVIGNRFEGEIKSGAMPWHHRYIGTPALSTLVSWIWGTKIGDVNCGMRGFARTLIWQIRFDSSGMEFASESLIRAAQQGANICEVPITLWPSAINRVPHLRSFRDGWRHLRIIAAHAISD
jgi:glycosyltransferase involved in cell wall biosynthesis